MPASRPDSSGCSVCKNGRGIARGRGKHDVLRLQPIAVRSNAETAAGSFHSFDLGLHNFGAGTQGFDQLAEAALQRLQERTAGAFGTRRGQNAARQAAVFGLDLDKARQHAVDAHLARVAAVDAGEQRLGQIIDGLLAVVIQQKFVNRTIGLRAVGAGGKSPGPCGSWRPSSTAAFPPAAGSWSGPSSSVPRASGSVCPS